ncbi:hypothetical protein DPMN_042216 [Dreissena polymorpha]|uniref:Uncharacterized protein n=1 Tax=Dreissena polymorpha TaxID=45954 RepID=A0A9D4D0P0_DREPO|nr:hypothetical protein DPMN_042216 [Dreissena polymorpha]
MLVTAEVEKQIEPPKVKNDDEATNMDTTYKIDQQKEAFVQGLIASGFYRQLAEQALDHIDEEDIITCNISQGNKFAFYL